jgi:hypothetical protein
MNQNSKNEGLKKLIQEHGGWVKDLSELPKEIQNSRHYEIYSARGSIV